MSYPTARVGNLTRSGDEIVNGSNTVYVDPLSAAPSISVKFNGQVLVFDEADIAAGEQDDPESDTGTRIYPIPPAGTKLTAQQQAESAANSYTPASGANATLQPNNATPLSSDCSNITGQIPYSSNLSTNFTLDDLSRKAAFSHAIQAQHGLTVAQIVCNLKGLATNPLEGLAAKYGRGNLLITSGFRPPAGVSPNSSGTPSQHELGQAADVQIPSMSNDQFWAAAQWVQANLMYDQFILEIAGSVSAGHRPWFHLSFNRNGSNRKRVNTYLGPMSYASGLIRTF